MKEIHLECLPDETLVKKLGIPRKRIIHHMGKSRVFSHLDRSSNNIALVDEDPGSAKTSYERSLKLIGDNFGVKQYVDRNGNHIFELKVKLEDWILFVCNEESIDISLYGLPENANQLHGIINSRIRNFENLLDKLINTKTFSVLRSNII